MIPKDYAHKELVNGLLFLKDNLRIAMLKLKSETENLSNNRETNWRASEFQFFRDAIDAFENLHKLQEEGNIK